jgi:asparagine synthase (glutamine-hydrolysing)
MCGIADIVHRDRSQQVNLALLQRMCASLRHRGPDDQGILRQGPVGPRKRRLSVIDLAGGHQGNHAHSLWTLMLFAQCYRLMIEQWAYKMAPPPFPRL